MSDSTLTLAIAGKIEGIKRSMNRVAYEAVSHLVYQVDMLSPVGAPETWKSQGGSFGKIMLGYKPGQFRGNWQLGIDQRPTTFLKGNIDPAGSRTVAKNIGAIPRAASRVGAYYLTNLCPYALALEHGHSKQAPVGMISVVRGEFDQTLRGIINGVKADGGRVR